jgi:hypothetical protein
MTRIIDLQGGELVAVDAAAGSRVRVLFGTVWLTEPGRLDDVFAASGEEVLLARGGRVLVESRGFARVIVPSPQPRRLWAFADLLARLRVLAGRRPPTPNFSTP